MQFIDSRKGNQYQRFARFVALSLQVAQIVTFVSLRQPSLMLDLNFCFARGKRGKWTTGVFDSAGCLTKLGHATAGPKYDDKQLAP